MKPIPAQHAPTPESSGDAMAPTPAALTAATSNFSSANRRAGQQSVNRAYPWLLFLSTLTAAFFCLLYITKPITGPSAPSGPLRPQASSPPATPQATPPAIPPTTGGRLLPGKALPEPSTPGPTPAQTKLTPASAPMHSTYEETNLRVQHILNAKAPGGHVNRIDIDVPVLYQSRNLRWTTAEVSEARSLMLRLMEHQDKTRQLKAEGQELLAAWSKLMGRSIPGAQLRADSPSLPTNQEDAASHSEQSPANASGVIQLKVTE